MKNDILKELKEYLQEKEISQEEEKMILMYFEILYSAKSDLHQMKSRDAIIKSFINRALDIKNLN